MLQQTIVEELEYISLIQFIDSLPNTRGLFLFDSAGDDLEQGRYSYCGFSPHTYVISKNGLVNYGNGWKIADPFTELKKLYAKYCTGNISDISVPFQGGLVGYFGYDLNRNLEKIDYKQRDYFAFPDLALGVYDLVIAMDHKLKQGWLFAQNDAAYQRYKKLKATHKNITKYNNTIRKLKCNFAKQDYLQAISRVKEYIYAGDIFQANISQCFTANITSQFSSWQLYKTLRDLSPNSFNSYINFPEVRLVSSSPERFVQLNNRQVLTEPIKGTISSKLDKILLLNSYKDRSENIMIVDLLRNDLSKVCEPDSVIVNKLCTIKTLTNVHHLESSIVGKLQENKTAIDLLMAAFPGGSVSGAPKVRAMEIIAEMEPDQRGPYCGAIGYIGMDGNMDTSIAIRTITVGQHKLKFQVGGAIVSDSDPKAEYSETLLKAEPLAKALLGTGKKYNDFINR